MGITLYRACNYIQDWSNALNRLSFPTLAIQNGTVISMLGYQKFIPLKLKKVINKACAANLNQRYQNSKEFRQALEKLTPNINWKLCDSYKFEGICNNTGYCYSISIYQTRQGYEVEVKKNNRRVNELCRSLTLMDEAMDYMNNHVASTIYS